MDDEAYFEFMKKAVNVFTGISMVMLVAVIALVLTLGGIIEKPLQQLIGSVRKGERPSYQGIGEFEFLSNTLHADALAWMRSIHPDLRVATPAVSNRPEWHAAGPG